MYNCIEPVRQLETEVVIYPLLSILIILVVIKILEAYLVPVFAPHKERQDKLYQGGEAILSRIRKYRAEDYDLTIFFLILHVIGFLGASLYILNSFGQNPINWVTIAFGAIIFYTIIVVERAIRQRQE